MGFLHGKSWLYTFTQSKTKHDLLQGVNLSVCSNLSTSCNKLVSFIEPVNFITLQQVC